MTLQYPNTSSTSILLPSTTLHHPHPQVIGSGESCLQTAYHVCCIMQDTSIKGEVTLAATNIVGHQQLDHLLHSVQPPAPC